MTDESRTERTNPEVALATSDTALAASQVALQTSRRRVENSLDALRHAVRETTGTHLERRAWALPLIAAAAGFSAALLLWRRRR